MGTTVPDERLYYLRALAASNDPWILQQYLDFAMEHNSIRVQDIRTVVENVARNPVGSLLLAPTANALEYDRIDIRSRHVHHRAAHRCRRVPLPRPAGPEKRPDVLP